MRKMNFNLGAIFMTCAVGFIGATLFQTTGYKLFNNTNYGSTRIGSSWTSPSLLSCAVTCQTMYTSCYTLAYNSHTGLCTPGSALTFNETRLSTNASDDVYYSNHCNKTEQYELIEYKDFIECLFVAPPSYDNNMKKYSVARTKCAGLHNGRLFTASIQRRFELFAYLVRYVIQNSSWIGLNDNATEGVYVWENGEIMDFNGTRAIFREGQPDNKGGVQDCVYGSHANGSTLLDDCSCENHLFYICEPNS